MRDSGQFRHRCGARRVGVNNQGSEISPPDSLLYGGHFSVEGYLLTSERLASLSDDVPGSSPVCGDNPSERPSDPSVRAKHNPL
jgi:hypothetical protein